jgi:hypothetical protein
VWGGDEPPTPPEARVRLRLIIAQDLYDTGIYGINENAIKHAI